MTMNVELTIRGDVIIYDKDDFWNFVFITDEQHEASYSIGGSSGNLRRINVDRNLTLVIADGASPTRDWGGNANYIFNMGDKRLHGDAGLKSNLRVGDFSPPYRERVHLKVAKGVVDASTWYSDYFYSTYPGNPKQSYGPAANLVSLTLTVENVPGKPALQLIEDPDTIIESWQYISGRLSGSIDNHCQGTGSPFDFLHYYDLVRDTRAKRNFFVAGRYPFATLLSDRGETESGDSTFSLMSPEGNCDPARIHPPPFP